MRQVCALRPNLSVPSIAVALYQREILSLGKAADFAGLHRMAFQAALYEQKVPINYSVEDLEADLNALDRILPS
ncbi:UPF0175 family protein [Phaeodactylibacter sp.]|uniref:UPF0175 family protein n=1 Tax=Phaeodactylibacter sp. TaxID=1940289 RepID=UPI0025F278EC|nr:UPF0175 family protein [Phaeodactylibacter sp.]